MSKRLEKEYAQLHRAEQKRIANGVTEFDIKLFPKVSPICFQIKKDFTLNLYIFLNIRIKRVCFSGQATSRDLQVSILFLLFSLSLSLPLYLKQIQQTFLSLYLNKYFL